MRWAAAFGCTIGGKGSFSLSRRQRTPCIVLAPRSRFRCLRVVPCRMSMARLIVDGIISELLYSSVRWFCVKSIANVSKGFKPILIFFLAACLAAPLPQAWAQTKEEGAFPEGSFLTYRDDADEAAFAGEDPCVRGDAFDDEGRGDGESPDGSSDSADPVSPADPTDDPADGPADDSADPEDDPADPADDSAGSAGSTDDPADPAGPAGDPAGPAADAAPPAASPSLPENDSPDGSAYRGATLRRTPLYASPDASQPEADFLWGLSLIHISIWSNATGRSAGLFLEASRSLCCRSSSSFCSPAGTMPLVSDPL